MLESAALLRSTKLNRAHESEIIQQHREKTRRDLRVCRELRKDRTAT